MTRRRRDRSERGAALVEAAIVTPLFLALIFVMIESGFLLHNYLLATSASGDAVRSASVGGSSREADFLVLQSLQHGLAAFDPEDVEAIVVYRADGPNDLVPRGCLSVPVPADLACNRYDNTDFFLAYTDADGRAGANWGCGATARDAQWCPLGRQVGLSDPGGPDHVGVYVQIRHHYLTGFLGKGRSLEINRVSRIEPSER